MPAHADFVLPKAKKEKPKVEKPPKPVKTKTKRPRNGETYVHTPAINEELRLIDTEAVGAALTAAGLPYETRRSGGSIQAVDYVINQKGIRWKLSFTNYVRSGRATAAQFGTSWVVSGKESRRLFDGWTNQRLKYRPALYTNHAYAWPAKNRPELFNVSYSWAFGTTAAPATTPVVATPAGQPPKIYQPESGPNANEGLKLEIAYWSKVIEGMAAYLKDAGAKDARQTAL